MTSDSGKSLAAALDRVSSDVRHEMYRRNFENYSWDTWDDRVLSVPKDDVE